ncbi:MAG TPA: NAD-dependent epimerase/dehydratase family protein [Polyangiaceae bacterium]|jgi:UDP-glucuronate 4-epimerase|nr:NAD-dependent epimerase/dehydratase family protein [Polyangiaceae bacterium]
MVNSDKANSDNGVLVTGGVGFIGYHVCRALLARGDRVTVVDDFSDAPYPLACKERNAADLRAEYPAIRILTACVTDGTAMEAAMEGASAVIHLAGLAGVRPSFADPARYTRVNVEGSATVHELARKTGVRRFVFASSSSVYGNSTPLPAHESAPALTPESPYAASKRAAELLVETLSRQAPSMPCAALRFFTVYGPRQRPEMAITLFTRSILAGKPITLFGDGSMRRDFTHVADIVRGVLAALDRAPGGFRAYNLGSGAPVDLDALIALIGRTTGQSPVVERAPVPPGDVDATFADLTRAATELGWQPRIPLDEGVRDVVDWARAHP